MSVLFEFPKDTPEILEAAQSYPDNYEQSMKSMTMIANLYGVQVGAATQERWLRLNTYSNYLDDILDRPSEEERSNGLEEYLDSIKVLLPDQKLQKTDWQDDMALSMKAVESSLEDIPTDRREKMYATAIDIGHLSLRKMSTPKLPEYVKLSKQECGLVSDILMLAVSDGEYGSGDFDSFVALSSLAHQLGALRDSHQDLREDYAQGLTGVKPNLLNRMRMGKAVCAAYVKVSWSYYA